jgi:major membrane immunogen (membrane-anchored lipoprotein)
MKLHSITTNENGARVSKGGNEFLTIGLNKGNKNVATIDFREDSIKIWSEGNHYHYIELKSVKQKGEKCISCGIIPDNLGRCKCCNKDAF